ncbi:hypothetical protein LCGC14_1675740, partial [marine sediment metagenome]
MNKNPRPITWNSADTFVLSLNRKTKDRPINNTGNIKSIVSALLFIDDGNDPEFPIITSAVALNGVNVRTASSPDVVYVTFSIA